MTHRVPSVLYDRWHRFRARLGRALRREGHSLWASLRDPLLGVLLALSLVLFVLAYQLPRPFALDIGRRPEEAYLQGFHAAEEAGGRSYRWTRAASSVSVPGLGRSAYRLDLTMAAPRPPDQPAPLLRLEVGGELLFETRLGPDMQQYTVLLPPPSLPAGDLALVLRSDVFTPTGDLRVLGLALDRLEVRPASAWVTPAPLALFWAGLAVLLAVLVARRLGWSQPEALGAGALVALALAAALAWGRPLLVPGLPCLPLGLAVGWLVLALFQGALRDLFRRGQAGLDWRAERMLWSVFVVFVLLRLGGVLHPAHETWDLCFHANRLDQVLRGEVFFTITSGEWRSQETLYLPLLYIVQAPLAALFGGRLVPFKITAVLLDTSSALVVAYVARRLLGRGQAAPLAALAYLTMPQSYIIFSWGIAANILGQWLYLLLLAFLVSPAGRLADRRSWLAAAGLLVAVLLTHPGAVLLAGALLAGLLLLAWLAPLRSFPRAALWRWAGAGLAALLLVALLYYSHFVETMWRSIQAMQEGANAEQPTGGGFLVRGPYLDAELGLVAVEVGSRSEAFFAGARELAAEARAYYHTWPLVLALGAVAGWGLQRRELLVRLAGLAFAVALLFAVVGLAVNLYVRYMYFLLPIVALGTAWWLGHLGRRGRVGRTLLVGAGLYLGLLGLWFWIEHVLYYSAGCR